jgi:hypothetical protein
MSSMTKVLRLTPFRFRQTFMTLMASVTPLSLTWSM